jgi:hypothetical protein
MGDDGQVSNHEDGCDCGRCFAGRMAKSAATRAYAEGYAAAMREVIAVLDEMIARADRGNLQRDLMLLLKRRLDRRAEAGRG